MSDPPARPWRFLRELKWLSDVPRLRPEVPMRQLFRELKRRNVPLVPSNAHPTE